MAEKKSSGKAYKVYTKYKVSGNSIEKLNKTCPKCGNSVFMGAHKDRWACGKCNYTEMKKR